ncbi:hypothetical protein CVT24_005414 [Panaeolus cyanescens]|uniref:C2H2-type domain-containing protein n=1 Tax=Panaeolus cyanescens TaxID=181874 RepID=A0A409Y8U3_9AGAR|nr:hypothetical protein CVT24_005414 [Panaeolus cyanescens]
MAPQRTRDHSDSASASGSQSYPQSRSRKSQATNKDACTVCGKVLSRRHDLQRHMKSHQPKDKACPYPECDFKARSQENLDMHIRRHTEYKPFVCQDDPGKCTYASYDAAGLHRHRKSLHGYVPNKGSGSKTKARPHRLPVTVLNHLADNDNESAQEAFNVFSAGKRAGQRTESDEEELDQLYSSSDESAAPRSLTTSTSYSRSVSAISDSAPSPAGNNAMAYTAITSYNQTFPQELLDQKTSAVFDAALNKYPFHYQQQLAVPPFWAVNPADQSVESLQGWNVDSDVKLEEFNQLPLEFQGQGSQEVYSFANSGENVLSVAAPAFDVDQVAADLFNTNSFLADDNGNISIDAVANQAAFEAMVMGFQWIQTPMGWVFANPTTIMPLEYASNDALLQTGESWTVSDGFNPQQLNLQ